MGKRLLIGHAVYDEVGAIQDDFRGFGLLRQGAADDPVQRFVLPSIPASGYSPIDRLLRGAKGAPELDGYAMVDIAGYLKPIEGADLRFGNDPASPINAEDKRLAS